MHLTLPFRSLSGRLRAVLSLGAAILAAAATMSFDIPLMRPFNLFRANPSNQWLVRVDLKDAFLAYANLSSAELSGANLSGANLTLADLRSTHLGGTNLSGANLLLANLSGANLSDAELSGANLSGAELSGANLSGAELSGAKGLVQQQLDTACGDAQTRLPTGLSVKFCSTGIKRSMVRPVTRPGALPPTSPSCRSWCGGHTTIRHDAPRHSLK
jgi:uncharacterized protein YjbI with pentapeptide repeats